MHELEALTAPALRRLIDGGLSIAVVPFGSIEQQGWHLPVGADATLAEVVAREVARQLGALLTPTFHVGCGADTVTLRAGTLTDVAVDVAESLARQGLGLVVFVSCHGGNREALDRAVTRLNDAAGRIVACAPRGDVGPQPGPHSGEWLTSAMLALRPDLVDLDNVSSDLADEVRDADAQRGARHIVRYVAAIVQTADEFSHQQRSRGA